MKRNEIAALLRLVNLDILLAALTALATGHAGPLATVGLAVPLTFFLFCSIADGIVGEWRANRDRIAAEDARIRKAEEGRRALREHRRMVALLDWEARR